MTTTPTEDRRDDADLEADVTTWLKVHWDPELTVSQWWRQVGESGWTAPHFPISWGGRGYSRRSVAAVRAAFSRQGALPAPGGLGLLMAAPTILSHGTPEQIDRFVPDIYTGSRAWCQLFSEPGSGSDLASLSTRAERDGDKWIINGQKVWSSMAAGADYGMLLARTDPSVPKHAGISWFAFPLDQPGVDVRPLVEITGHALFNEVFIDQAEVSDTDLIGGLNNGWSVTQSTLMFERTGIGAGGTMSAFPPAGARGGLLDLRVGDAAMLEPPPSGSKVLSLPELIDLAREYGRSGDPLVRQKLARLIEFTRLGNGRPGGPRSRWPAVEEQASPTSGSWRRVEFSSCPLSSGATSSDSPPRCGIPTAQSRGAMPRPWCLPALPRSMAEPTRCKRTSSASAPLACPVSPIH